MARSRRSRRSVAGINAAPRAAADRSPGGKPRGCSGILSIPPLRLTAVSDPHPARPSPDKQDKRTFLQKVAEFIHPGPDSTAELIETLADAEDNDIIGPESRVMLEGVIRMAGLTAGDVMVAAPRMARDMTLHTTRSCTSSHDGALALTGTTSHRESLDPMAKDAKAAEFDGRQSRACCAGGLRPGEQGPDDLLRRSAQPQTLAISHRHSAAWPDDHIEDVLEQPSARRG